MLKKRYLFSLSFLLFALFMTTFGPNSTKAQDSGQNPTPLVITLTPSGQPTAVPTGESALLPDRLEPNNDAQTATEIGLQTESDLTLTAGDVDYFTGYLKTGQVIRLSSSPSAGLDTRLKLYWDGQLVAENDDRSPADLGSTVTFAAPAHGWYVAVVEKATVYDGRYDLETMLMDPTATPTVVATSTPTPSSTPFIEPDLAEPNNDPEAAWPITPGEQNSYTLGGADVDYFTFIAKAGSRYLCETETTEVDTLLTVINFGDNDDRGVGRVDSSFAWTSDVEQTAVVRIEARGGSFGQYTFGCQTIPAQSPSVQPPSTSEPIPLMPSDVPITPLPTVTTITTTSPIPLTVRPLGSVQTLTTDPTTHIRLLVYYDANNDRQPGPGEGVASVSVLAVDGQGQQLAQIFTNAQGEAIFNLSGDRIARIIVPFVPGWSARVRVGEQNNDIVLGLPAVRLPIFLPVQTQTEEGG